MDQHLTALERAFQLAKSGSCTNIADLKRLLKSEGYGFQQIEGRVLAKQLVALMNAAKSDPPPDAEKG